MNDRAGCRARSIVNHQHSVANPGLVATEKAKVTSQTATTSLEEQEMQWRNMESSRLAQATRRHVQKFCCQRIGGVRVCVHLREDDLSICSPQCLNGHANLEITNANARPALEDYH